MSVCDFTKFRLDNTETFQFMVTNFGQDIDVDDPNVDLVGQRSRSWDEKER